MAERTAAISIIQGMGPQKYPRSFKIGLTLFSSKEFRPNCISRDSASALLNPLEELFNPAKRLSILSFSASSPEMILRSAIFSGLPPKF